MSGRAAGDAEGTAVAILLRSFVHAERSPLEPGLKVDRIRNDATSGACPTKDSQYAHQRGVRSTRKRGEAVKSDWNAAFFFWRCVDLGFRPFCRAYFRLAYYTCSLQLAQFRACRFKLQAKGVAVGLGGKGAFPPELVGLVCTRAG